MMTPSGLLLLFVASRLLYLVLIDPRHLLTYAGEEIYRGTIAQELLTGLSVLLLFRMLSVGAGGASAGPPPALEEKPSLAYPVLLGLTAGFGLWFDYIYGLTLLALLGFWLWHDKGRFWRPRDLWFALGFLVGFAPWIVMNLQTHFAGFVIHGTNVWAHFGPAYLWEGLAHPRQLALYEFFADIASNDPRALPRRAVNLLYSLLYLGPILTGGVLRLKAVRSDPAGGNMTRLTLVGFAIWYLILFAVAVQFSDFRATRYHLPAYPFLFFLVAHSLARCHGAFPNGQKKIQIMFLASVVVLSLGTHAPLLSLDRPGYALSAKGYSYSFLSWNYWGTHAPAGSAGGDREGLLEVVQRPLLSSLLPQLASHHQPGPS